MTRSLHRLPPRRLMLTYVPRRDAAHRLSLAFCLLLRELADPPSPALQPSTGLPLHPLIPAETNSSEECQ